MQIPNRFAGAVDCFIGLVYIAISIPLVLRRIGMNGAYGVRIPKAFESEANWYAINHYGGWWLIAAGAALCVVGVVALRVPPRTEAAAAAWVLAPTLASLLVLIPIFMYGEKLGK